MFSIRRLYVYLVSGISLLAVSGALIALARNVLLPQSVGPLEAVAFQIAVVVIGLPIFLVHWLWAQRSAAREVEERASLARRLYLYVMMAVFLAPMIDNVNLFVRGLLNEAFGVVQPDFAFITRPAGFAGLVYDLIGVIVLLLLWYYHRRVLAADKGVIPEAETSPVPGQIYSYLFTGIGLAMSVVGIIGLLSWLAEQFQSDSVFAAGLGALASQIALLAVGLALWLIFWRDDQRRFYEAEGPDRDSVVRKLYLYLVVFLSVYAVLTPLTLILADLLGRIFGVSSGGAGSLPLPLATIVVNGAVWAYHARQLRKDAGLAGEVGQQAQIRRIYLYLMAGIGLAAVLVGLGGVLSVLIRALAGRGIAGDLGEQLAAYTAVLLAGLPLWLIHWRRVQIAAALPDKAGQAERQALVRRIYLYFFLFVATLTMLGSAVFVVAQIVSNVLGVMRTGSIAEDLGQAIAFVIIAVAVWIYHGLILRSEGRLEKKEQDEVSEQLRVAVVDAGDGSLGQAIAERVRRDVPGVKVEAIALSAEAGEAMSDALAAEPAFEALSAVDMIVGPWTLAAPAAAGGQFGSEVAEALLASNATKLLIPVQDEKLFWAGVPDWRRETIVRDVSSAVKQKAAGKEAIPVRRQNPLLIIAIVLVVLCLLGTILPGIFGLFFGF